MGHSHRTRAALPFSATHLSFHWSTIHIILGRRRIGRLARMLVRTRLTTETCEHMICLIEGAAPFQPAASP